MLTTKLNCLHELFEIFRGGELEGTCARHLSLTDTTLFCLRLKNFPPSPPVIYFPRFGQYQHGLNKCSLSFIAHICTTTTTDTTTPTTRISLTGMATAQRTGTCIWQKQFYNW